MEGRTKCSLFSAEDGAKSMNENLIRKVKRISMSHLAQVQVVVVNHCKARQRIHDWLCKRDRDVYVAFSFLLFNFVYFIMEY